VGFFFTASSQAGDLDFGCWKTHSSLAVLSPAQHSTGPEVGGCPLYLSSVQLGPGLSLPTHGWPLYIKSRAEANRPGGTSAPAWNWWLYLVWVSLGGLARMHCRR
jgi:hypothetical protein